MRGDSDRHPAVAGAEGVSAPDYTVEEIADGQFEVKVGNALAGYTSEDGEHPGVWVNEDQNGRLMGRSATRKQGAEFLAARFIAEEPDWSLSRMSALPETDGGRLWGRFVGSRYHDVGAGYRH